MAHPQQMGSSLGSGTPRDWTPGSAYSVRLTFTKDGAGNPVFTYSDPIFDEAASAAGTGSSLDLRVAEDCIIILETDAAKGLYWSLATGALSLKDGANARYYFLLKYIDRGVGYDRNSFPQGKQCSQICFGARLNTDDPAKDRHPFNLDVELERKGQAVPIHIDPDIKNPSV